MSDYILSCCSTADLTKEDFERRDIHFVSNSFELDGIKYKDDLGQSVSYDEFYEAIREGASAKTVDFSVDDFKNYFEDFLKEGFDILHVTLSSGVSDAYKAANAARRVLSKQYPERTIYVVDSMAASSGYGLIMETLADKRDEGASLIELHRWILENRMNMNHISFSTNLTSYIRDGIVSRKTGKVRNVLRDCTILTMNYIGELVSMKRIRTKRNAYKEVVERAVKSAGENYTGKVFISNSDCKEDAKKIAAMLKKRLPKMNGEVQIRDIGTTTGSHAGPGTVAVFFWGAPRFC